MSNHITVKLDTVLAAALAGLPRTTGATASAQAKIDRPVQIVLADVSASMAEPAGGRRKIDVLSDALRYTPQGIWIAAFSSHVRNVCAGEPLPEPEGGTALHLALRHARLLGATQLLVISDGHPDDARLALAEADLMSTARIDIVYCGPEHDIDGLNFMCRLARNGGAARHANFARPQQFINDTRRLLIGTQG